MSVRRNSLLSCAILCIFGCTEGNHLASKDPWPTKSVQVTLRTPIVEHEPQSPVARKVVTEWQDKLHLLQPAANVYSGSEPKSEAAFKAIAEMGVRTIVSVDGIRPNIEAAAKHGLRYVHIPIGYDGIDKNARLSLVHLAIEIDGSVCYVHCHHGRHRGPAASAIVCRAQGSIDSEQAVKFLHDAGTDSVYAGLYRDVKLFETPPASVQLPPLKPVQEVGNLAKQMAGIDRIFNRVADVNRQIPEDTVLLLQLFRETARQQKFEHYQLTVNQRVDFLARMDASAKLAQELHDNVASSDVAETIKRLRNSCVECHQKFRDN